MAQAPSATRACSRARSVGRDPAPAHEALRLVVEAHEAERFMVDDVIVGRADIAVIARWLERYIVAR